MDAPRPVLVLAYAEGIGERSRAADEDPRRGKLNGEGWDFVIFESEKADKRYGRTLDNR